jgi:hypothetical protein
MASGFFEAGVRLDCRTTRGHYIGVSILKFGWHASMFNRW